MRMLSGTILGGAALVATLLAVVAAFYPEPAAIRPPSPAVLRAQGNVYSPVGIRAYWCQAQDKCEVARR